MGVGLAQSVNEDLAFWIMARFICTALAALCGWVAYLCMNVWWVLWPENAILCALTSLLAVVSLYIGWTAH